MVYQLTGWRDMFIMEEKREVDNMTIKQVAEKYSISTQAVYKKIRAAGLKISDVTKENSAELSETGLEIVNRLFAETKEKNFNSKPAVDRSKELEKEVETLKTRLEEVTAERDKWAAQAEADRQTITRLQDALQEEQKTAQQAQALNMAAIQKLTAPRERRSLWARLTGKK